jgi:hypothetical protein
VRKFWVVALTVVMLSVVEVVAAPRPPEQTPPASVVVASAEESRAVAQARVVGAVRPGSPESLPSALPLLFVGSLLLGLAAAVRRTT